MKMSTPSAAGKTPRLWALSMLVLIPFIGFAQPYNEPCNALPYDFGGGSEFVPCGPSANATPSYSIDAASGLGGPTTSLNGACGGYTGNNALWTTFIVQEGGSFEWQTVPGADKFNYELWVYSDPVDTPAEEDFDTAPCDPNNLIYLSCGSQFTGWKIESTPDPSKKWRFFLVQYLTAADKDGVGDSVIKIRKSCGEACVGSTSTVSAGADVCIESGTTQLQATTGLSGYLWSPTDFLDDPQIENPTFTAGTTTTYTVVASGPDGCPASDQVTVTVGGCCEAIAGTLSNDGAGPWPETLCQGKTSLNTVTFSASGQQTDAAYGYALFLVDEAGNISNATAGSSGSFTFSSLSAGIYTVYGISFKGTDAQAQTYVSGFATLAALQADIPPTCAEIVSGGTGNQVTILGVDCGSFN